MSWKDGCVYADDHLFEEEALSAIRPDQLVRYFKLIAYGTETPGAGDRPTQRRSSGISFCKKAISYFMADGSAQWNSQGHTGNPTMSKAVNKCIQEIKKHEVRKQGKKSNAKSMKQPKFIKTLDLLSSSTNKAHQYKLPAMLKLQFHLIGRTDDICNLETKDLRENEEFPGLLFKQKWLGARMLMKNKIVPIKSSLVPTIPTFVRTLLWLDT